MEKSFLIDTNILIYYTGDFIPKETIDHVDEIFTSSFNISVITKLEYLGWDQYNEDQYKIAVTFIDSSTVLMLDNDIVETTIQLQRRFRMKLPDAIIAATCLVHGLTLVTRNIEDFKSLSDLAVYNPFP